MLFYYTLQRFRYCHIFHLCAFSSAPYCRKIQCKQFCLFGKTYSCHIALDRFFFAFVQIEFFHYFVVLGVIRFLFLLKVCKRFLVSVQIFGAIRISFDFPFLVQFMTKYFTAHSSDSIRLSAFRVDTRIKYRFSHISA